MFSATLSGLAATIARSRAQTLQDLKCTGNSDIPWDEQIAGCTNAINSAGLAGKDLVAALLNRGKAYLTRGDLDRALADFEQVIKLDPATARAFAGRGNVYFGKRDYDRAIADYGKAIALDPNYVFAFNNRANAYAAKGQYDRCADGGSGSTRAKKLSQGTRLPARVSETRAGFG